MKPSFFSRLAAVVATVVASMIFFPAVSYAGGGPDD